MHTRCVTLRYRSLILSIIYVKMDCVTFSQSCFTARLSLFHQLKQWPYLQHITGTANTKLLKIVFGPLLYFPIFWFLFTLLSPYLTSQLKCCPLFFPTPQFSSSFLITLQTFLHTISLVSGLQSWSVFILLNPNDVPYLSGWRMSTLKSKMVNYKPTVPLWTMLSLFLCSPPLDISLI